MFIPSGFVILKRRNTDEYTWIVVVALERDAASLTHKVTVITLNHVRHSFGNFMNPWHPLCTTLPVSLVSSGGRWWCRLLGVKASTVVLVCMRV